MSWSTKWIKTCSVDDCNKPVECKGVCNAHYQRFRLYGRYESAIWSQTEHPCYYIWNERKNAGLFCKEWADFKIFLKDVGDRPSNNHRLSRPNKKELFGPANFIWIEYYKVREGETRQQKDQRRRAAKPEIYKRLELKKVFDLPYEDWEKLVSTQNNVCKICGEPEKVIHHVTGKVKSLAVDHCHKSKVMKIRGLLCQRCNRVLGKVKDSIELLDKMKAYLNDNC